MNPITYPARPINSGPLNRARPKPPGDWYYEPKYNGWRALVNGFTGEAWNRHGQSLTIGDEFKDAIRKIKALAMFSEIEWWDCEALERRHNIGKGCLVVLDWVPRSNFQALWWNRNQWLHDYLDELDQSPSVREFPLLSIPPTFQASEAMAVWGDMQSVNKSLGCDFYEGLVAKRADSPTPSSSDPPTRKPRPGSSTAGNSDPDSLC